MTQGSPAARKPSRPRASACAARSMPNSARPRPRRPSEASYTLLKFHGTNEQFDRDTATARKQAGEDKDWSFMVRVRAPAGRLTAAQWLALDDLAGDHADGTLRLTSRQGVQFHGILRENLRASVAAINATLLTTLAACGDVVRNVITSPAPRRDAVQARLEAEARRLSDALLPKSRAHHEIFLGAEAPPRPRRSRSTAPPTCPGSSRSPSSIPTTTRPMCWPMTSAS